MHGAGAEALALLQRGAAARRTGDTRTNLASSRSHCVFTVALQSAAAEGGVTAVRTSRLHLVDLAGAEAHIPFLLPITWVHDLDDEPVSLLAALPGARGLPPALHRMGSRGPVSQDTCWGMHAHGQQQLVKGDPSCIGLEGGW